MYIPKYAEMNDIDEITGFICQNSFAVLISTNVGKINATHVPVVYKKCNNRLGCLYCHIAKANQQWKNMDNEVLVIFPGPHCYVSSSWYETDQSVPTWNYLAVHVYGNINQVECKEEKIKIVSELTENFEGKKSKYKIENLENDFFERQLKGIVVFEIKITKLEGKKKLSQNHSRERQDRIINKLDELNDYNATLISDLMKKNC
ncbi:MAG: Protease synthase and sporulation protein PAI 2 [Ignavibacteria bacterium]|nr:Protease synthase and sporulation protein PAI 2 [Ignavibacteria bacterium]